MASTNREHLAASRRFFPVRLSEKIGRIYRSTGLTQIDAVLDLTEWLFIRLNNLNNSSYMASAEEVESIDGLLRSLKANQLSLGHHVSFLRSMTKNSARGPLSECLDAVGCGKVPTEAVYLTEVAKHLEEAIDKFQVPSSSLEVYFKSRAVPKGKLGAMSVAEFGDVIVRIRNQKAHSESKQANEEKHWWRTDAVFAELLSKYVLEAVEALLAWPPMIALLTRFEIVTVVSDSINIDGDYTTEIVRHERLEASLPLGQAYMTSKFSIKKGDRYWADGLLPGSAELAEKPIPVCELVRFPKPKVTVEKIWQLYQRHCFFKLENDGIIDSAEQAELVKLADKYQIAASRILLEKELNSDLEKLAEMCESLKVHELTYEELLRRVQNEEQSPAEKTTSWGELRKQVDEFANRRALDASKRDKVLKVASRLTEMRLDYLTHKEFASTAFLTRSDIMARTGLAAQALDILLSDLVEDGLISAIGGPIGAERGYYKRVDVRNEDLFNSLLARLEDDKTPPDPDVRVLLKVCASLLHFELPEAGYPNRVDVLLGDVRPTSSAVRTASPAALLLRFRSPAGEQVVAANTLAELYRQFWSRAGNLESVKQCLPFPSAGPKYIVSSLDEHPNGVPFRDPISIGGVFCECNFSTDDAVRLLEHLIELAGLSPEGTSAIELLPEAIVEGDSESALLRLKIGETVIEGGSVAKFFSELLGYLLDKQLLDRDKLPIKMGRVRNIMAMSPEHDNGRLFRAKVERGGIYMETAMSWADAMIRALEVCEVFGVQAVSDTEEGIEKATGKKMLEIKVGAKTIEGPTVKAFLSNVVDELWKTNRLSISDIPWDAGGRDRYVLAKEPKHKKEGSEFIIPYKYELGDFYIETHYNRDYALEIASRLVAAFGPREESEVEAML